ncbi:MAG: SH3 domain-containing protein [Chloroflexi bacterium]|nr:SH3 domain-containing protein [Chloroflexota bacterium]
MRKPLLALGLAVCTSCGAPPVADVVAATSTTPSLNSPPLTSPSANSPVASTSAVSGSAVVQLAMKYLGFPYTATGNSPSTGFSCIGFASFVYRSLGIPLPGDLADALAYAPQVSFNTLMPGDLVFFQNTVWPGISHVGIYIGGGKFIHAEWYNRGVVISSFNNDPVDGNYWIGKYLGANRPWNGPAVPAVPGAPGATTGTTASGPSAVPSTTVTTAATGPAGVVTVYSLNVRSGPSLTAPLLETVPQGTAVTVVGKKHGWLHVRLADGTVGWVIAGAVSVSGTTTSGASTGSGTGTNGATTGSTSSGSTNTGTSTAPARAGYPKPTRKKGSVTVRADGLRVHTSPSTDAPVITTVNQGEKLKVVARSNGWIEVRLPDGTVGWISAAYASGNHSSSSGGSATQTPGGSPATSPAKTGRPAGRWSVAQVAMNVRSGPSLSSSIITVLAPGASYRVLGRSAGWVHVQLVGGATGWINGAAAGQGSSGPTYSSSTYKRPKQSGSANGSSGGSVVTATVRVHSGPGINKPVVGMVAAGTRVQVIGYKRGWALVRLPGGATGYVLGSYVR